MPAFRMLKTYCRRRCGGRAEARQAADHDRQRQVAAPRGVSHTQSSGWDLHDPLVRSGPCRVCDIDLAVAGSRSIERVAQSPSPTSAGTTTAWAFRVALGCDHVATLAPPGCHARHSAWLMPIERRLLRPSRSGCRAGGIRQCRRRSRVRRSKRSPATGGQRVLGLRVTDLRSRCADGRNSSGRYGGEPSYIPQIYSPSPAARLATIPALLCVATTSDVAMGCYRRHASAEDRAQRTCSPY